MQGFKLVRRETCLEYYDRRLKEGWVCIQQNYPFVVLLSPDGIIKSLDLRNDIETLRPNATGDQCTIPVENGCSSCPNHYDCVYEVTADEATTEVSNTLHDWTRDLYNLPASSGSGVISKIVIYARTKSDTPNSGQLKISLKSNSTVTDSPYNGDQAGSYVATSWTTYSYELTTNPADSGAWEWADIDALQIGIYIVGWGQKMACTQVYVEVYFTVPPPGAPAGSVIPILLDTLVKLKPFGSQPFKPFKSRFPTFTPRVVM